VRLVGRRGIRLEWLVDGGLEAGKDTEAQLRRDSELFVRGLCQRKGAPSPNELAQWSLAENAEAMRRWSSGVGCRRVARGSWRGGPWS